MIIGTCGFGSSGSSVISDYLKEFDCYNVIDDIEYNICYMPDGIRQLDFALNEFPVRNDFSSFYLKRFKHFVYVVANSAFIKQSGLSKKKFLEICDDFINKTISTSWMGYNGTEFIDSNWFSRTFGTSLLMQRFIPLFEKVTGKAWKDRYPFHRISFCVKPNSFITSVQDFNEEIINELSNNNYRDVVLDQPFPGDNPESCMKYFRDSKAIVVDRDPRDTYIFLKTKLKHRGSFMPSQNVKDFIKYYRGIRNYERYGKSSEKVLFIRFEDMVYNYEETTSIVRRFLNLPENPCPKTIFIPEKSMANTQLIERFPEFQADIEQIECELEEFLFNFDKYPKPEKDLEMFYGHSNIQTKKG